jgi:hypothetical protein
MGEWVSPSDEEIIAQIPAAICAEQVAAATEPRAARAWFDDAARCIVVELTNGDTFGFSPGSEPELAELTEDDLRRVRIVPGGDGLRFEDTDAALSVPGLFRMYGA